MSLWDVSKSDINRVSKINTNAGDTIPSEMRLSHGTTQINYVQKGSDTTTYGIKFKNGKIEIVDSNGNTVGRLGFNDTLADNKVETSKPGSSL